MVFQKKLLVILLLVWIAQTVVIPAAYGQEKAIGEYDVKAAFLYSVAKFVEWPDASLDNKSTLTIYILGDAPFGSVLDTIRGKTIKGKTVVVNKTNSLNILKNGDILFISNSEKERLKQILNGISHLSILTVGDTESFAQNGVMVNFYIENNRIRFEINMEAARLAGLKISSNLLKMGKIIAPPMEKEK